MMMGMIRPVSAPALGKNYQLTEMGRINCDQELQDLLFTSNHTTAKGERTDEELDFEQQVKEMLANGRLCSWVSVKGD